MKILNVETHRTKRIVRIHLEDGSKITGTEAQFMADHWVGGTDVGQQLIAAVGPLFSDVAETRDRISQAFAAWDHAKEEEKEEREAYENL